MIKWTVDRFEGEMAVIECDGYRFNVPRAALPDETAEGDSLTVKNSGDISRNEAKNLMNRVFKKD